jgi:hypothetical protein
MATTDIAGWLDDNESADEQDREDLLAAIREVAERGNYRATKKGRTLLVGAWGEEALLLANQTAKARLIREVESLAFGDSELRHAFRAPGADSEGRAGEIEARLRRRPSREESEKQKSGEDDEVDGAVEHVGAPGAEREDADE